MRNPTPLERQAGIFPLVTFPISPFYLLSCTEGYSGNRCEVLNSPSGSGGLSAAAVAAIVLACLVGLLVVAALVAYTWKRT